MTNYYLAPHMYWCQTADGIVFLDASRQRYVSLGGEQRRAFQSLAGGEPGDLPAVEGLETELNGMAEALLHQGVLTTDSSIGKPIVPIRLRQEQHVTHKAVLDAGNRITAGHVLHFLLAWLTATRLLRSRSFDRIVLRVQRRKLTLASDTAADDAHAIEQVAAIFARLRPFLFTAKQKCMLDTLAFVEFAAWYGLFPTWVIGVMTQPFAAHTWAQHGDIVLNDTTGHVRRYAPILAV